MMSHPNMLAIARLLADSSITKQDQGSTVVSLQQGTVTGQEDRPPLENGHRITEGNHLPTPRKARIGNHWERGNYQVPTNTHFQ